MPEPSSPARRILPDGQPWRIGALAPMTQPGWVEAGRHLLAGIAMAVEDVNCAGGIAGRPLEPLVRDTAADPAKAAAAVAELAALGAAAVVGEYHSVAARAAAAEADAAGIPFLCSSAVLDALIERPSDLVARIAPPQSRGWAHYARFLLGAGHRRAVSAMAPSLYWSAGAGILRAYLEPRGGSVLEIDMSRAAPAALCDELAGSAASACLLLVGHPEPAVSIVRAARSDRRLANLMIGAPAGQPEFADWASQLGESGTAVPFLRYMPERLTALGNTVKARMHEQLGETPSFVAFEGYDSVIVLAPALRRHGPDVPIGAGFWSGVVGSGTRATIALSRPPGTRFWQWADAPIDVADREPRRSDRCRSLLKAGPAYPG